ncbi:5'-3' exoribonuclease-like protein [Emericellopsis cladophorae]|uniref:5'-3' exoribonuclease n=1 Tax=Emericellopsis cladophorae TaxID=2686198 RepID=A0A9Q0BBZ8_9HYPO|nr:5'-3' exoribonuclease-like protein [Emericellopsis cladophorae]KAI6780302.1 5'-3' exoribonuclease-like protein [Emericellopsis cladophorae]
MGIPAAFRWLSNRYPKIISPVMEDQPVKMDDGSTIPVDTTRPNPNGEEFDNLYLDMNGIVHPCTHPEDRPAPKDEEEMMLEVFRYTDRVVNMVRPRKLLMIAVDGVAPRAKMNQQRSRRFRSAQEAKEKADEKQELIKLLKQQHGGELPPDSEFNVVKQVFDSNTITPGTPFMDILAISLRYWCQYKLNTDPGWAKLKVIISDATVPGEGEHKIMAFVRSQRASPEHDPNTRHVIYGLDADLIMLGLATHEPHFRVLREDVFFQDSKARMCKICGQKGHDARNCKGDAKEKEGQHDEKDHGVALKPFIWLHVSVLREYLAIELSVPDLPFRFDLERAVDDWIFMCCFVGNDFLPHLPALEIREDGIDTLMAIWRDNLPSMGGYVTKDGHIDMDRAQIIMNGLAKQEDAIFKRRKEQERRREANAKRRKLQNDSSAQNGAPGGGNSGGGGGRPKKDQDSTPKHLLRPIESYHEKKLPAIYNQGVTHDKVVNRGPADANAANKSAASVLKSQLRGGKPAPAAPAGASAAEPAADTETASALGKRKAADAVDGTDTPKSTETPGSATPAATENDEPVDNVRLWEDGYQDRYYQQKFGKDPGDLDFRKSVAHSYAEGLAWVLLYYFQGCPSWEWYYPYHYAPFAADFRDLNQLEISFEKGRIAKPFEQLMSVLPAGSRSAIPDVFHPLMLEENSEIIDFYPQEFETDLNGKKFAWQGVALLPFIDMQRLLSAVESKYHLLSEDDKARNGVGKDILILSDANEGIYDDILTNFYSKKQGAPHFKLNPKNSGGMSGKVAKMEEYVPHGLLQYPLKRKAMPDLDYDSSVTVIYEMPTTSQTHKSMLLRGAKLPPPALNRSDIEIMKSKSRRGGRNHGGAPLGRFDHNSGRHEPVNYGPNGNGQRGGGYRGGRGGGRGGNGGGGYGRGGYPPQQSFPGAPPPGWQPPPPGGPGFGMGGPPPPPPTYQQQGGRGGYNNGWAPPPGPPGPPGYYGQYQGQPPPPAPSYRGNGQHRDSRRY